MDKPKWQKAKINKNATKDHGFELFVRTEKPTLTHMFYDTGNNDVRLAYDTNITVNCGKDLCAIEPNNVELLPIFEDDVPIIDYNDWKARQVLEHFPTNH